LRRAAPMPANTAKMTQSDMIAIAADIASLPP
jgi:hypothetical protein